MGVRAGLEVSERSHLPGFEPRFLSRPVQDSERQFFGECMSVFVGTSKSQPNWKTCSGCLAFRHAHGNDILFTASVSTVLERKCLLQPAASRLRANPEAQFTSR